LTVIASAECGYEFGRGMLIPIWEDHGATIIAPSVEDVILFYGGVPDQRLQYAWMEK